MYDMSHQKRGYALIINNDVFYNDLFYCRKESENDLANMQRVFYDLGFDVIVKRDKTVSEMKTIMTEFAQKDHSDRDCFVCVVMSKGSEQGIEGVNGEFVTSSDLINPFRDVPTLNGKPKIFIIQADGNENASPLQLSSFFDQQISDKCNDSTNSRPTDILVYFSSVYFYRKWLDPEYRSCAIDLLARLIKENANQEHLVSIMSKVNEQVARYYFELFRKPLTMTLDIITHLRGPVYWKNKENGQVNETGKLYYESGKLKYDGMLRNGLPNGLGMEYKEDGGFNYIGDWENGIPHGRGELAYERCFTNYKGDWERGVPNGWGLKNYDSGRVKYNGMWKDGVPDGKGISWYENASTEYTGEWKKGKMNGFGKYLVLFEVRYEGEWKDGKAEGKGTLYNKNGKIRYQGLWRDGKPCDKDNSEADQLTEDDYIDISSSTLIFDQVPNKPIV